MSIDLQRFDSFKDAELRSLEIVTRTHIKLIIAVQDSARAFDWITLELEFVGVSDARFVEENKLQYIDMSDGVSLLHVNNEFAFGIGACDNASTIKNSTLYIISKDLKYKEGQF